MIGCFEFLRVSNYQSETFHGCLELRHQYGRFIADVFLTKEEFRALQEYNLSFWMALISQSQRNIPLTSAEYHFYNTEILHARFLCFFVGILVVQLKYGWTSTRDFIMLLARWQGVPTTAGN